MFLAKYTFEMCCRTPPKIMLLLISMSLWWTQEVDAHGSGDSQSIQQAQLVLASDQCN